MKRRGIILLLALVFFLPVITNAAAPQQEDLHPHATVDVWVDALGSYNYYWNDLDEGYTIRVDIDVTYGSDIDFYIVDEENYDDWVDGYDANADVLRENVGSVSLTFTVPSSGEWHLLFINDNWLFRKHLEGTITVAAPYVPNDPSSSAMLGLIGLGLVVVCIAVCVSKSRKDAQKKQSQSPQSRHDYQIQQPASQQVVYCSYCGTPKQHYDALFCSKCGRAFSGPEFG
ncbi:MAG: hypothetical protein RTV72_16940 [Candidatus Thorarchaeota archaeon]